MRYCVVGLGPAGAQALEAIRERDPAGEVRVFSDERVPFYFRASLPQYALGLLERDQMWGLPDDYYAARRVQRVSARVTGVDTARRRLTTEDGAEHPYDRLLLACGTAVPPRRCRAPTWRGWWPCARWRTPRPCGACARTGRGP